MASPRTVEFRDVVAAYPSLRGQDGAGTALRIANGFIQWKRDDQAGWANLIAVSDIEGLDGRSVELRTSGTALQTRQTGGDWITIFDLANLKSLVGFEDLRRSTEQSLAAFDLRVADARRSTEQSLAAFDLRVSDATQSYKRLTVLGRGRPGETRDLYTRSTAGGPAEALPLFDGTLTLSARGLVFEATGEDRLISRRYVAFEPGRRYQARAAFFRASDASDPSNDTVRTVIFHYDQALNPLTGADTFSLVADVDDLTVAAGRREVKRLAAMAGGDGINIVAPTGAVFHRIGLITFGGAQRTHVEVLDLVDVTDSTLVSADVAGLASRIAAQESLDAGGRLPVIEAAIGSPNAISYATRLDAQNARIPISVRSILLRGIVTVGKGASEWVRSAVPGSAPIKFTSADGAVWEPAETTVITPEQAGAIGDGAMDDFAALDLARQFAEAKGCPIRLSRNYFLNTMPDLRNVVLDPTPAAALTGNLDLLKIGKVLAELKLTIKAFGIEFTTAGSSKDRPTGLSKGIFTNGSAAARVQRSHRAINCANDLVFRQQLAYPGGDTWIDTPAVLGADPAAGQAAVNANQIKWNIAGGGGTIYAGLVPIHGAQCLQGHFAMGGDYTRCAIVRTSFGYYMLSANATGQITLAIKLNGQAVSTRTYPVPYPGLSSASAYQPGVARWELQIENRGTFRLKLNGTDVTGRIDTLPSDEILDAGFGVMSTTGAVQPAVDNWTLVDTTEATGASPFGIGFFGDSQAATRNGDMTHVVREVLDGTNGIRCGVIFNVAVPGSNSLSAVQALTANGVGAARYIVLVTGVNDQQGNSAQDNTRNNVANFIDGAKANGTIPIIVIEPRYLSRAEGNQKGFDTAYAGSGEDYRGGIINIAAGRGAIIVDLNEITGPIVPGGVAGAFEMIEDNIHWTPYGKRLAGKAIADAIIAAECRPMTAAIAQKQMPPRFANAWAGTTQYPTYSVTVDGTTRRVHLGGVFTSGGTTTAGTLMYTLPRNLWPKAKTTLHVRVQGSTQRAVVDVSATDGGMRVYEWPANGISANLDSLDFEAAA